MAIVGFVAMDKEQIEVRDDLKMKAVSILYRLVRLHMKTSSLNKTTTQKPIATSSLPPPISRRNMPSFTHPPSAMRRPHIDPLPHVVRVNSRLIDRHVEATPLHKSHSSLVRLPQLQLTSDSIPRDLIRKRNVDVITSSKVMRSARLHRAKSPPRLSLSSSKLHFPPSCRFGTMAGRTSSSSLTPLATSSSVTLSSEEPYYEETREIISIASPYLPRRPLIHCHQRPTHSDTHRFIRDVAKRNRRPTTPPWSSIVKEGLSGIHEDILVSYYNTSPAVDARKRLNRQSMTSRFVLPDTTHGTGACSVHTSKLPGHNIQSPLSSLNQEQQPPEQLLQGVSSDHSNGNNLPAIISQEQEQVSNSEKHCGNESATAAPLQVEERERAANKEGENTNRELLDSGVQKKMKGMKQEESGHVCTGQNIAENERIRNQVTFTVSCFDDDLAANKSVEAGDEMQLQRPTPQSNTVNSCVSIVIDPVEEENEEIANSDEYNEQIKSVADPSTPDQVDPESEDPFVNPEIKLQSILDYVKNRRTEFAKLLEEHAEIVHEINKFEGGVTS